MNEHIKLKSQFTLRIYDEKQMNKLQKLYERTKHGFDSIADFINYCLKTGVDKLLGDVEIDHSKNLTDIASELKKLNDKIASFDEESKFNNRTYLKEFKFISSFLNCLLTNILELDCNKSPNVDFNNGILDVGLKRSLRGLDE